jgi:hypothetical protein
VRHNLSSNRAFRKVERSAGERGKGFYWAVEADCERMFEEQEARAATSAASGGKDSKPGGRKGKTTVALEPPLKRSVRGEPKGPLPPPLTSTPLVFKREPAPQLMSGSASGPSIKDEFPSPLNQSLSNGMRTRHRRSRIYHVNFDVTSGCERYFARRTVILKYHHSVSHPSHPSFCNPPYHRRTCSCLASLRHTQRGSEREL